MTAKHFLLEVGNIQGMKTIKCKNVVTKRKKEQAKSKIDKIEKILGAKIVCACPRCVRGQGNAQKRATRKRATLNVYTTE